MSDDDFDLAAGLDAAAACPAHVMARLLASVLERQPHAALPDTPARAGLRLVGQMLQGAPTDTRGAYTAAQVALQRCIEVDRGGDVSSGALLLMAVQWVLAHGAVVDAVGQVVRDEALARLEVEGGMQ